MKKMKIGIFLLLPFLLASPVYADTFINGGFESGDFTGWTKNGGYFMGEVGMFTLATQGSRPL